MKNLINKKVLETVKFSTNTVGPLAYLVHKMSGKGSYILEVYRGDKPSYSMGIECSEKHNKTSEQIDLSGFENDSNPYSIQINDKNGYLVFYNSKEFTGNRILIKQDKTIEFDSFNPAKGDRYALNLLRPGKYKVQSKTLKSGLAVDVAYPSLKTSKESRYLESPKLSLKSVDSIKKQGGLSLLPNQGLIIELDKDFQNLSVEFVKENNPRKGESIREQLKAQLRSKLKDKPKSKKYTWRAGKS